MTQWHAGSIALAVSVLLIAGLSVESLEVRSLSSAPDASSIELAELDECLVDTSCTGCLVDEQYEGHYPYHRDGESVEEGHDGEHPCERGSCGGAHPDCDDDPGGIEPQDAAAPSVSSERWADIASALDRADPASLRVFLAKNPHRAFLNVDRGAIQIEGCSDKVIANFPLQPAQLAGLVD